MQTKFEGVWRLENVDVEKGVNNHYVVQYNFQGDDFILSDLISGHKVYGTFTLDDENIYFSVFYLDEKWSQAYLLKDGYFELRTEPGNHWAGRFVKIKSVEK